MSPRTDFNTIHPACVVQGCRYPAAPGKTICSVHHINGVNGRTSLDDRKRCKAYQCGNPAAPGGDRCPYHLNKRRAMQAAAMTQPDCVDCNNKAARGSERCRSCQDKSEAAAMAAQARHDFHSEFFALQRELPGLNCNDDTRQWLGRLLELVGTTADQ